LAEEVIVERDLKLLAYAGGRLHFAHISSPESLDKIRQAKKAGLPVTCDVSAAMLCIDEQALEHFDTVYKVNPPLRGKKDIEALWKGLADGTISAIASDHLPQDIENKALEFDQAAFGMEMLETAFAAANTFKGKLTLDQLVALFGEGPRKVLGLSAATITEKTVAELTIFSADQEWVVSEGSLASKSKNNPFIGKTLKGKAKAVITPKGVALCP
jgi:dihydroorotase